MISSSFTLEGFHKYTKFNINLIFNTINNKTNLKLLIYDNDSKNELFNYVFENIISEKYNIFKCDNNSILINQSFIRIKSELFNKNNYHIFELCNNFVYIELNMNKYFKYLKSKYINDINNNQLNICDDIARMKMNDNNDIIKNIELAIQDKVQKYIFLKKKKESCIKNMNYCKYNITLALSSISSLHFNYAFRGKNIPFKKKYDDRIIISNYVSNEKNKTEKFVFQINNGEITLF